MNLEEEAVREFAYESVSFNYHLILENRKTIAATVFPSESILVKAPLEASDQRIDEFLQRKFRWVLKQKRYFSQFRSENRKSYVSGETFQYRGRSYKLLIHGAGGEDRVSLQHGILNVFVSGAKSSNRAKQIIDSWYRTRADLVFSQRLSVCLQLFDYDTVPALAVRKMNKRWGSYSPEVNKVTLNLNLIKAATRYIDYVIVHELCHISCSKHNSEFYSLLKNKLPKWRKLKTELELSLLG